MDERILDDEDERIIKVKKTKEDVIEDVVDALAASAEEEEVETEIQLDFPETDEYDEDLVGLTPEQLQAELARREEARKMAEEKCAELVAEGEALINEGLFEEAEPFFVQALVYADSDLAKRGLWAARTENFAKTDVFYQEEIATEVSQTDEQTHAFLMEKVGERLQAERRALEEEAAPLRETVMQKRGERRSAFRANRNYYVPRFFTWFALFIVSLAGVFVGVGNLVRTRSDWPLILICVCAGLCAVFLTVTLLYTRKLVVAQRLCRDNEKLSATEEGAILQEMEEKIEHLTLVLDGEQSEE